MHDGAMRGAQALRALAHPLRWKILDLLAAETSATATRCAAALGESVASCSYHLGILAKYGYLEPVPNVLGRERPWRLASVEQTWSMRSEDADEAAAAAAVTEVFLDHELARLKDYILRRQQREPAHWRSTTGNGGLTTFLTPEELREVTDELRRTILRYADRLKDPSQRPPDGREVRLFYATSLASTRTEGE